MCCCLGRFLVLCVVLLTHPASAFTISPMSLTFPPKGGTQTIKVKNPSDVPVEMTLRIFAWNDSGDPSSLQETIDLIAMPPIFEVPPNGEQTVRVALRRPLEVEKENTYRILIGKVPSEVNPGQAVGLNLTVNIPIFVRPDGAKAEPIWSISTSSTNRALLTLANEGKAHLKLGAVQLITGADVAAPFFEIQGGYVLGGDQRHWPLDVKLKRLKGPLRVRADSNIGPIETEISLPES